MAELVVTFVASLVVTAGKSHTVENDAWLPVDVPRPLFAEIT